MTLIGSKVIDHDPTVAVEAHPVDALADQNLRSMRLVLFLKPKQPVLRIGILNTTQRLAKVANLVHLPHPLFLMFCNYKRCIFVVSLGGVVVSCSEMENNTESVVVTIRTRRVKDSGSPFIGV